MEYNYNNNNSPYPQEGSQIGGYPNYSPQSYPPGNGAYDPGYHQGYPQGQFPQMPQYQPQYNMQQNQVPQMPQYQQNPVQPNKIPAQGPKPTVAKQSPKIQKNSRNNFVVWPQFVSQGTNTMLEFRRKKRYAAINNVYQNDMKRFHVTPKSYKRRKMNIKDASTGAKICKIQVKASVHRTMEVKDMAGNVLLVTRCRKVIQFKKRFDVFLMNINPDYKNREPDLIVQGSVRKAKKFKIQSSNGKLLASLQKEKKKGMERFRGKASYHMQVQPDADYLLMTILLLIQDELFEKTTQTSTGGGFSADGGGGGDCGGGGGCDGGGC